MTDDRPLITARCTDCGDEHVLRTAEFKASPCAQCGSSRKAVEVTLQELHVKVIDYVSVKAVPEQKDPRLPEKGVKRWYSGHRFGRDGRLVQRSASYDPYTDIASERVIDAETGEVIVDKVEKMSEKYQQRGRWSPPDGSSED